MTVMQLCRVTVQSERDGLPVAVDFALPIRSVLGELLPFVIPAVVGSPLEVAGTAVGHWVLSRLGGTLLDESVSLHDNDVHDGDVLLLAFVESVRMHTHVDPCRVVIEASPSSCRDSATARRVGAVACVWAMGASAAALTCGSGSQIARAVVAALIAAVVAVVSVAAVRLDPAAPTAVIMGAAASLFAAVAGFLAVPGGPAPPNFFLAATVCAAMATVLLHTTPQGLAWLVAITAFSVTVAVAAAANALWPVPVAAVGAALAVTALALLGMAAKLAILLTGMSPNETSTARARRGHAVLTGLLVGFSASAALGAVLVGVGQHHSPALNGVCLTTAVSVVLLLRARQHRLAARVDGIFGAGMVCASAAFVSILFAFPVGSQLICLLSAAMGFAAVCLPRAGIAERVSPVMRRGVDLLDYVALASVVPLACWVAGGFAVVRGLSLT
jgi:ESX secretion system protein EccD